MGIFFCAYPFLSSDKDAEGLSVLLLLFSFKNSLKGFIDSFTSESTFMQTKGTK